MSKLFKALALLVLLLCGSSLVMLWHWDSQGHQPSTAEALLYLLVLPLLLFAILLLLRWAWQAVWLPGRAAAAASTASTPAAAAAAPTALPSQEEQDRQRAHPLLSAQLLLNAGGSAGEALDALQSGKTAPAVDAELRNAKGLPILAARLPDLDLNRLSASLPDAERELRPATRRALATLLEPLQRCGQDLSAWTEALQAEPQPQLRLLLQLGCTAQEAAAAGQWAAQQLAEASGLAPERLRVESVMPESEPGASLWQQADRLLSLLQRERSRDLLVLAAAHSHLDETLVERWEAEGRLFDAERQPKGLMPGEGAAVLVLGPPDWPASPEAEQPLPHLHRPVLAQRDKSIEASGKVGHQVLEAVLAQTLAQGRCGTEALGSLVCDADRHGPRNTELFGAVLAHRLSLDPVDDMQLLGAACGHLAGVGPLAAVALAAHQAALDEEHKPRLVLGLNDLQARLGLLVRHGAPPPAPTPA